MTNARVKNRISELRNNLSLTQEKLASLVGVTRQTIIALEQNRYNPSLVLAHDITVALRHKNIEAVFSVSN